MPGSASQLTFSSWNWNRWDPYASKMQACTRTLQYTDC